MANPDIQIRRMALTDRGGAAHRIDAGDRQFAVGIAWLAFTMLTGKITHPVSLKIVRCPETDAMRHTALHVARHIRMVMMQQHGQQTIHFFKRPTHPDGRAL